MFFCERFRTSCCISPTKFKKPTISGNIVGFLKLVGEMQQLVRKHSQKNKRSHISRAYNQINCRNIWFAKVITILFMTEKVLFFQCFFRKRPAPQCRWEVIFPDNFLINHWITQRKFTWTIQRRIEDPVKHVRWSFLLK